jgi:hypothetical protein
VGVWLVWGPCSLASCVPMLRFCLVDVPGWVVFAALIWQVRHHFPVEGGFVWWVVEAIT